MLKYTWNKKVSIGIIIYISPKHLWLWFWHPVLLHLFPHSNTARIRLGDSTKIPWQKMPLEL